LRIVKADAIGPRGRELRARPRLFRSSRGVRRRCASPAVEEIAMTTNESRQPRTAAARALALLVAANGWADPRELQVLEALGAFERLGLTRARFLALVHDGLQAVGYGLVECSWLRARDEAYVDQLLEAVTEPQERLLVCRLAAAAIAADGQVSHDEHLVFNHVLGRWRIDRAMLVDPMPRASAAGRGPGTEGPQPRRPGAPEPVWPLRLA
jgi:tellurite resistance protein